MCESARIPINRYWGENIVLNELDAGIIDHFVNLPTPLLEEEKYYGSSHIINAREDISKNPFIFFILHGQIKVVTNDNHIMIRDCKNGVVGEMAILNNKVRNALCVPKTPIVTVYKMPIYEFHNFFYLPDDVGFALRKIMLIIIKFKYNEMLPKNSDYNKNVNNCEKLINNLREINNNMFKNPDVGRTFNSYKNEFELKLKGILKKF